MSLRTTPTTLLIATWLAGCECASTDIVELGSDGLTSTSDEADAGAPSSSSSSTATTGEPFDASRWIGRYHFEHTFQRFGEPSELPRRTRLDVL